MIDARISMLIDGFQSPGEALDYSYRRQLDLNYKIKRGIAGVVTAKRRLEMQRKSLEDDIKRLDKDAREAMAAGRENLAEIAVQRKVQKNDEIQTLGGQIDGSIAGTPYLAVKQGLSRGSARPCHAAPEANSAAIHDFARACARDWRARSAPVLPPSFTVTARLSEPVAARGSSAPSVGSAGNDDRASHPAGWLVRVPADLLLYSLPTWSTFG
jgi:hypothetical protein